MKIPKAVTVGRVRYAVLKKTKKLEKTGAINYAKHTIEIASKDAFGSRLTQEERSEIFWHELTHGILFAMDSGLAYNERFVKRFGKLLSRAVGSAEM